MAWAKFGLNRGRSGQARRWMLQNPRIGLYEFHHDFLSHGDIVRMVDAGREAYSPDRSRASFSVCTPERVSSGNGKNYREGCAPAVLAAN